MARLPLVPERPEDPVLAELFDGVRSAGIEHVPTIYRVLGNSPQLLRAWTRLAWPLRHRATTPRALRELVILRVAQLSGAGYEWSVHKEMALDAGVGQDQIDALGAWEDSDRFDGDERALLRFADEMTREVAVSEATFDAVAKRFTPAEVVELTLTAAFYACVSRVLLTLGIDEE